MCWLPNAAKPTAGHQPSSVCRNCSPPTSRRRSSTFWCSSPSRDPQMPDVATVIELTKDTEAKQIFRQLVSNDEIGRSLFTTPNVPPERLRLLRTAFQKMIADPEFRAEAEKLTLPIEPKSGEEMQKVVADMFAIAPETLAKIRELSK